MSKTVTGHPIRNLAFVLASTDHGSFIVNRFDYKLIDSNRAIGVGCMLLSTATYEPDESNVTAALLGLRRALHGDGVVAIDVGANIGVFTVDWAKAMTGWGSVIAIEAQEWLYYALAGNITLNNCFNVRAIHAAVMETTQGPITMPRPNYAAPGCFGGLQVKPIDQCETMGVERSDSIGQPISYIDNLDHVCTLAIDDLPLQRIDLIKLDIEGMEIAALLGAQRTITQCKPILIIEWIQTDLTTLHAMLDAHDYVYFKSKINIIAIHRDDPVLQHVQIAPE
jgi:FkbM family methyltransferase